MNDFHFCTLESANIFECRTMIINIFNEYDRQLASLSFFRIAVDVGS